MSAHVTSWGKQPLKFRTEVAMMGKLGFDIRVDEMSEAELHYSKEAVLNYKRLNSVILDGNQYRLVSPYDKQHAVLSYVDDLKNKCVLFAFDLNPRYGEINRPVRLKGLDENKQYKVSEINLINGQKSKLGCDNKTYSGDYLMKIGLPILTGQALASRVLEISAI